MYNHKCIVDTDIVQSGDNWRERGYAGVVYSATELCIRDSKCIHVQSLRLQFSHHALGIPWPTLTTVLLSVSSYFERQGVVHELHYAHADEHFLTGHSASQSHTKSKNNVQCGQMMNDGGGPDARLERSHFQHFVLRSGVHSCPLPPGMARFNQLASIEANC